MYKIKFLLSIIFLVKLAGCSQRESELSRWHKENGKIKVLATIAMVSDLVEQIGGEEIDLLTLICGELDPHSYELVKGDDEKFACADLIFYNGLGLEHSLSLRRNLEGNPKAVAVADKLLHERPDLILKKMGTIDPHVWMDISLWQMCIDPIVEALCLNDPDHGPLYRERALKVKQKLVEADASALELLQSIDAKRRYLVTSHDAFQYFTRRYLAVAGEEGWQERCQAPEGLAPEAQMSVNDVAKVLECIETHHIPVLFPESNLSRDALKKILDGGRQKGVTIRLCPDELYGDSMGGAGSYLEMMAHNVQIIARELKK